MPPIAYFFSVALLLLPPATQCPGLSTPAAAPLATTVAATAPVPATAAVVATPAVFTAVSPAAVPMGLVSVGCPSRQAAPAALSL